MLTPQTISKMTGVTVHTLYYWEDKLGVIGSEREGCHRLYTEESVVRIKLFARGRAINHPMRLLKKMSNEEIEKLLEGTDPLLLPEPLKFSAEEILVAMKMGLLANNGTIIYHEAKKGGALPAWEFMTKIYFPFIELPNAHLYLTGIKNSLEGGDLNG